MKKLWTLLLTLVFVVGLISPAMTTTAYAQNDVAMTVNGTEYTDHATGWSAAVKLAKGGTETTVKLFADWIADAEKGFVCPDGGTNNGALHVNTGKVILDLNGYTLDRNTDKDVASYTSSVLHVQDCTFTVEDTSAEKKGKITGGYAQYGGGIYAVDCNLYINGGNITGNRAKEGGGVYSWEDNMVINGGCISKNTAENGGGLHTYNTKFDMNNGSITDNEATLGGGAYVSYSVSTVNGGVIARNRAASNGGGVMVEGKGVGNDRTKLVLRGGVIEENYAGGKGGAIYFHYSTDYDMYGGTLRNNTAYSHGGAIYCYCNTNDNNTYTHMNLYGGSIIGNESRTGNGGVRGESNAVVYMKGGSVADNKSDGHGGGFYFYDGNASMYLTGGSILRNKSSAGGGIYWESLGTLVMTGGVITENHTTTYEYGKTWNSNMGGGVHVHHFDEFITEIGSDPYIGGTIQIYGNTSCTPPMYNEVVVESNLYLSGNDVMLNHAMGQKSDVPNMPLTDGANVGISMEDAELIADDYSKFNESSLKYLHADCDNFYIQSVLDDDYYEVSLVFQSAILAFDKTEKKATVYITKPGKYTLIFADYENDALKNVDFVEYDFEEGINYVSQSNFNIYLGISDKIMLWHDTKNLIHVCKAYIVE